jgi:hypothetical protein
MAVAPPQAGVATGLACLLLYKAVAVRLRISISITSLYVLMLTFGCLREHMPELSCSVGKGTIIAIASVVVLWVQKRQTADK